MPLRHVLMRLLKEATMTGTFIFSQDSQAAIKALDNCKIYS
jgi:hypothetical protein